MYRVCGNVPLTFEWNLQFVKRVKLNERQFVAFFKEALVFHGIEELYFQFNFNGFTFSFFTLTL